MTVKEFLEKWCEDYGLFDSPSDYQEMAEDLRKVRQAGYEAAMKEQGWSKI